MTTSNATLTTINDNSHFGGDHTRNKKVDWNTCDSCPAAMKSSCTSVCAEMERFLAANGNTITHNSPTEKQSCFTVEGLTSASWEDGESGEFGSSGKARPKSMSWNPLITTTSTPESRLIEEERSQEATSTILTHVSAFAAKAGKQDARKRSMIESILILHYLEDYNSRRIAELLGARFEEFQGYETFVRKSGKKAGFTYTKPKGDDKVFRIIERFKTFVHSTHLSDAIHQVMASGSVEPIRKFAKVA